MSKVSLKLNVPLSVVAIFALLGLCVVIAYADLVPTGYLPKIILHLDFGSERDDVVVNWGSTPGQEYVSPSAATNLQVVSNYLYLMEQTTCTIKKYSSPGTLVWQSQTFRNLGQYTVASDGRVYLLWGTALDKLSSLDDQGKLVWTKDGSSILPRSVLEQLGMRSSLGIFFINWTSKGLVVSVVGTTNDGLQDRKAILLDKDGQLLAALDGAIVGTDGIIYDFRLSNKSDSQMVSPLTGRDAAGNIVRSVSLNFASDNGAYLVGQPAITRVLAAPEGGFTVESAARLPKAITISSHLEATIEDVLWRFDEQGALREQWRFPATVLAKGFSQIVVGSDGKVYHVEYGDDGIDVVSYGSTTK